MVFNPGANETNLILIVRVQVNRSCIVQVSRGGLTKGHGGTRAPGLRGPTQDMKRKHYPKYRGNFCLLDTDRFNKLHLNSKPFMGLLTTNILGEIVLVKIIPLANLHWLNNALI